MGLFERKKDADEIKAEKVKKLEKDIEGLFSIRSSGTWEENKKVDEKLHGCIVTLEELVGVENLSNEQLRKFMKHHWWKFDREAIRGLYPEYSRRLCEEMLSAIDWAPDTRSWKMFNLFYLIGGQWDYGEPVVACPDLNQSIVCAEKWLQKDHGDHKEEAEKTGIFFLNLVQMLKKAGYPDETIYWDERQTWLRDRAENPAVAYLHWMMLSLCWSGKETRRIEESNYYYEQLKGQGNFVSEYLKWTEEDREDGQGTVKSAEEKKQIQIEKLENKIELYRQERKPEKWLAAVEELEKLAGAENLKKDVFDMLMDHYSFVGDYDGMKRLMPVYSRYYYEDTLGSIFDSLDTRNGYFIVHMIDYLVGSIGEYKIRAVVCPDLDLAAECAEKYMVWEQENDILEDKKAGSFFLQLIQQLKEAGYPGTEIKWEGRIWWMLKHMENSAVGFLFDAMLNRGSCPLNSDHIRYMLDHQELENLKAYSRNEGIQNMVMKEWNRRFPADR